MVSHACVGGRIWQELLHRFDEPTTVVDLSDLRFLPQHVGWCVASVQHHVRVKLDQLLEHDFHGLKRDCAGVVSPFVGHALIYMDAL